MPPRHCERSEAISIRWPWRLLRFANKEIAPFAPSPPLVMAALVAAIHVFRAAGEDVDGRDRPGHDERRGVSIQQGNKEIAPFALSPPLVMAALVAAIHVFG